MRIAHKTLQIINESIEKEQEYHRWHLGASVIGKKCQREVWYSYRWVKKVHFDGRMLRLFSRGHDEEIRVLRFLNKAGIRTYSGNENGQLKIVAHNGHFGGSLDGAGIDAPDFPVNTPFLLEFKTINDKGFSLLSQQGLLEAKWQHFVQMQIYMRGYNFRYGLYLTVNKNNDHIHIEVVEADHAVADNYIAKAGKIIYADEAPVRMSSTPSWYECKFCDFNRICHFYEVPDINCRTCAHASPSRTKKEWECQLKQPEINQKNKKGQINQEQPGCAHHLMNPNFLNGAEILGGNLNENYLDVKWRKMTFKLGPNHVKSGDLCNIGTTK